ncbi:MAG: tetratricopeptide repeat protein [Proteobacteria bacterium]|nr:tetratricopeptide repeat protein [Pseudomonadota bacterium]
MPITFNFLDGNYNKYFKMTKDIDFTPKELDVISCILTGRRVKEIAGILSNSVKTIDNHIRNIMQKLGCNSREGIINCIEQSGSLPFFRYHYQVIAIQADFTKKLKEVSLLVGKHSPSCLIAFKETHEKNASVMAFLTEFEKNLKEAGIHVSRQKLESGVSLSGAMKKKEKNSSTSIFYVMPFEDIKNKEEENELEKNITPILVKKKDIFEESPEDSKTQDQQKNYYDSFFEVLQKILPTISLDAIISNFESAYKLKQYSAQDGILSLKSASFGPSENKETLNYSPYHISKKILISIILLFVVSGAFALYMLSPQEKNIKSDLILPTENTLLKRFDLISKIDEKMRGENGIQTVALVGLVGMGGVGKTTLARYYGHMQHDAVVWELNAENKSTLMASFNDLAYSLAKTKKQKEDLEFIQKISDLQEREKQILSFVKETLKEKKNWVLIYDNVENFSEIKNYFPQDPDVWGYGKVILTTRDSNINNTSYIKSENIIEVGELQSEEALKLFSSILFDMPFDKIPQTEKEKILKFLDSIPPFPLDVSLAARYIKNGKISYEKYLELIQHSNEDFENTHEQLLKEASDYTKTRHKIVTLSLEHLLSMHPDFKDLLILMCLLDSQHLPVDFLKTAKSETVVEDFIHALHKYSFVSSGTLGPLNPLPTHSMHRSTQEISLSHLISKLNLAKNDHLIKRAMNVIENYIDNILEKEEPVTIQAMTRHCKKLLSHSYLLTKDALYTLRSKLGHMYYYANEASYQEAQKILEENIRSMDGDENFKNKNNFDDLIALGLIYSETSDIKKLKETVDTTLLKYKKILSERTPKAASALSFLGMMYDDLGDYTQGQQLIERACALYKNDFPNDLIGLGRTLAYLGRVYREQGKYELAQKVLEESYEIYKNNGLEKHFRTGWTLVALGNVYLYLGDYEKATNLLSESVQIYKDYFPDDPFCKCWAALDLANAYIEQGNPKKACEILEECLDIYKKRPDLYPETHYTVVRVIAFLGKAYMKLGDYQKARVYLEKALPIFEMNYGKEHLETAYVLTLLGELDLLEEKFEASEKSLKNALSIFVKNNHPEAYKPFEDLFNLSLKFYEKNLKEKGSIEALRIKEESLLSLKQVLEHVIAHFPKDAPHFLTIKKRLENMKLI